METYQINILNPKAIKLLQDLADLELISIKENNGERFLQVVERLRKKAATNPPTLEEITKEVELVREKRYESRKGQNNNRY